MWTTYWPYSIYIYIYAVGIKCCPSFGFVFFWKSYSPCRTSKSRVKMLSILRIKKKKDGQHFHSTTASILTLLFLDLKLHQFWGAKKRWNPQILWCFVKNTGPIPQKCRRKTRTKIATIEFRKVWKWKPKLWPPQVVKGKQKLEEEKKNQSKERKITAEARDQKKTKNNPQRQQQKTSTARRQKRAKREREPKPQKDEDKNKLRQRRPQ